MQLVRPLKTSDPLGRYYTADKVGALLVHAMALAQPGTVVDLGAGDGALTGAAAKAWPQAQFITVDIDHHAKSASLPERHGAAFRHYVDDVLDVGLASRIGVAWGQVDAALCNPPYLRPKWQNHFAEILEDAGLSHVLPRINEAPSDLLFIAQNLRFLRSGGQLGLILPDGIISGEKFLEFRKTLMQKHAIKHVIELPRGIFRKTDAKAHILVLAKHDGCSSSIVVSRMEQNGSLSPPLLVSMVDGARRLDYSSLTQPQNLPGKIRDIAIGGVARGNYGSAQRKSLGFPVFHTTDFVKPRVGRQFQLTQRAVRQIAGGRAATETASIALPGDILVARVGRNLSQKVCLVATGKIAISDCVLRLRVGPQWQLPLFNFLRSSSGQTALASVAHGVGAQFITANALLDLPFLRCE